MLTIRQLQSILKPTICRNVSEMGYCCENRQYRHPGTHIFERLRPIRLVGKGKYPVIKKSHYVYKHLPPQAVNFSKTMSCVLTKEIVGTGLEGQVVEVPKAWFRNELYPLGLAVYASPENIEKYEEVRKKSRDYGIDYKKKMAMLKISKIHVNVFMNTDTDWILDENHVRIAMRKSGVVLSNENIILDREPITTFGSFTFWVQLQKVYCTEVKGKVHPLNEVSVDDSHDEFHLGQSSSDQRNIEQPVLFYEDVFGAKEAFTPGYLTNNNNSNSQSEDKSDQKT